MGKDVLRKSARFWNRLALVLLWLGATMAVAFVVARAATNDDRPGGSNLSPPPIDTADRATTTLTRQVIQPVITSEGEVVQSGEYFILESPPSNAELAYRLLESPVSVKATITGGPAGFDCAWLGIGKSQAGSIAMRCQIPNDIRVVAGLSGTMGVALSKPEEANALPNTAVVGTAGSGQVIVVEAGGQNSVRNVQLGRSDTFWTEITGGLESDEVVLVAPVQADFLSEYSP